MKNNVWKTFKDRLQKRTEEYKGTAAVIGLHLHLWETIRYLDVVHPETECAIEGLCTMHFLHEHIDGLEELNKNEIVGDELDEIKEIIGSTMAGAAKDALSELDELFDELFGDPHKLMMNAVYGKIRKH